MWSHPMFIQSNTFAKIYYSLLKGCMNNFHHETAPRGLKIREVLHTQFELTDPLSCLYQNERRSTQHNYVAGELLWYYSGKNDVQFITNYSKFWEQIKNVDDTCNSAYGYLIFNKKNNYNYTGWQWAKDSLIHDKDTRQAAFFFNQPDYQYIGNKDFPCTCYGIFEIRANKLNLSIKMRSNDLILGLQADIVFFVSLLQHMHLQLKSTYPDLEMGSYFHYVDSLHIYERHFELVDQMFEFDFKPESLNQLTTSLIDDFGKPSEYLNQLMLPWVNDNTAPNYKINEILK